ncbi:STAS domain-containing protein [Magnetococcus sp. PR-3]|uniref:STAS domain-containing protein n=1 Tax=Magnetococcus sp. PR-3 TaxID=3120355 RepID=UPI002FCE3A3B
MSVLVEKKGEVVTIKVQGEFNFHAHDDFRKAYESQPKGCSYRIDLSRVEHLDSSAFGMLLMLREKAGGEKHSVTLVRPTADVRKLLEVVRFDGQFQIES